jgi:PPM family protein phosphatase
MPLLSAGKTDIGKKRKTNQDCIYLNKKGHTYLVADGMGGHASGDLASRMAVELFNKLFTLEETSSFAPQELVDHHKKKCQKVIEEINRQIIAKGQSDRQFEGMGTTLVGLLFVAGEVLVPNIGDSRAYLVHKKSLFQLTKDHSLVQEKINLGLYDRQQAARDPVKNVIVRTVGIESQIDIDIFHYRVHRNDVLLLCSDGLHGKLQDEDLLALVNTHLPDPASAKQADLERCVQILVEAANFQGGGDNISVVLVVAQ